MLFHYIDKLRAKSEPAKKRFAFITALCVCGVIIFVWVISVVSNLNGEKEIEDKIAETPTPSNAITANIKDGFSALVDQFHNLKGVIKDFSSSTKTNNSTTTP